MARAYRTNVTATGSAIVAAAGTATITIRAPGDINWLVSQVSIEMQTAPAGSVCQLRKNGAFVTFLISTGDAAGGDPPIMLRPQEEMTVDWTGCTPGDQGRAFYVYDEVGWGA